MKTVYSSKNPDQHRVAEMLVAWMQATRSRTIEPEQVDPAAFIQWLRCDLPTVRYAVLWGRNPAMAAAYRVLVEGGAMSPLEIWEVLPPEDRRRFGPRISFQNAVKHLRTHYQSWVHSDKSGKISAKQDTLSTETIAVYCGWLGCLWKSLGQPQNPWWEARAWVLQGQLKENKRVQLAEQALAQRLAIPGLIGARDSWLLCGIALLGMTASEIVSARRIDLRLLDSGHMYLHIDTRPASQDVVIGPAAASWLHRFEGTLRESDSGRSEAGLSSSGPVFPSLSRGRDFRSLLSPLRESTIRQIVCSPAPDGASTTIRSLRRVLEASFGQSKRTVSRLMGRSAGTKSYDSHRDDEMRLAAQLRAAEHLGIYQV